MAQYQEQIKNLNIALTEAQNKIQTEENDKMHFVQDYLKLQKQPPPENFTISQLDNTSNLWSETITVSDEFSEIKPNPQHLQKLGVEYDPNQL